MTIAGDKPSMVEVLQDVMDQLDALDPPERDQVMAAIATRYGKRIQEQSPVRATVSGPRQNRRPRSW
ncbi:MAG: hypothetical protein ACO1SV_15320 [Fimbriimonas sp.]